MLLEVAPAPSDSLHRVGGGSRLPPPPTERSVQISCTTLFGRGFTALLVCYSFESCFHGRRFISLHRWPYPPLHGGHVAFEQFHARWPLPHVAGSPDLGVLSASLTAIGPSDRSRRFGLAGPKKFCLSPTALPCSHETFGQHAGGTNPGSISRRSPWHVMKLGLPPCGIRSATSTTIDFGANCPFTFVPAYCLPVYASQRPLPDTTQDSVRGCRLSFTAVAISGDMVSYAFKAQPAQNRTCGFPAYGSHLGCLTANRSDGHGCRILGLGSQALAISRIRCHVVLSLWLRRLSVRRQISITRRRNATSAEKFVGTAW